MDDFNINSIRTDIRTENEDYDKYAILFLSGLLQNEIAINIIKYFPFFSQEMQKMVINESFDKIFDPNINISHKKIYIDLIDVFVIGNYLNKIEFAPQIFNLFNQIIDLNSNFQIYGKEIIKIFSNFISIHSEIKNQNFFNQISQFILHFHGNFNLLPLYKALIVSPPFPSIELIKAILIFIDSNLSQKKHISSSINFLAKCFQNKIEFDYYPLMQKIPELLTNYDKKIFSSFFDLLIFYPETKPEIFEFIQQVIENINEFSIKIKSFELINQKRYYLVWKEKYSSEIIQFATRYLNSENNQLSFYALNTFFLYQDLSSIPYSIEIAQIMIDNFETPLIAPRIAQLFNYWIADKLMDDETKKSLFEIIVDEYENIKLMTANYQKEKEFFDKGVFFLLNQYIDIIYKNLVL